MSGKEIRLDLIFVADGGAVRIRFATEGPVTEQLREEVMCDVVIGDMPSLDLRV